MSNYEDTVLKHKGRMVKAEASHKRYVRDRRYSIAAYLETGETLNELRTDFVHGYWGSALESMGIPSSTADRMMKLSKAFGSDVDRVIDLGGIGKAFESLKFPTVGNLDAAEEEEQEEEVVEEEEEENEEERPPNSFVPPEDESIPTTTPRKLTPAKERNWLHNQLNDADYALALIRFSRELLENGEYAMTGKLHARARELHEGLKSA